MKYTLYFTVKMPSGTGVGFALIPSPLPRAFWLNTPEEEATSLIISTFLLLSLEMEQGPKYFSNLPGFSLGDSGNKDQPTPSV